MKFYPSEGIASKEQYITFIGWGNGYKQVVTDLLEEGWSLVCCEKDWTGHGMAPRFIMKRDGFEHSFIEREDLSKKCMGV